MRPGHHDLIDKSILNEDEDELDQLTPEEATFMKVKKAMALKGFTTETKLAGFFIVHD